MMIKFILIFILLFVSCITVRYIKQPIEQEKNTVTYIVANYATITSAEHQEEVKNILLPDILDYRGKVESWSGLSVMTLDWIGSDWLDTIYVKVDCRGKNTGQYASFKLGWYFDSFLFRWRLFLHPEISFFTRPLENE